MTVKIKVVVMSLDVDVWFGGGDGATTPGQSISPADTETASAKLRIVAMHI
jgi:hypothetical protein